MRRQRTWKSASRGYRSAGTAPTATSAIRWIGQRISGPDIDIAMMARAQGAEGIGPVAKASELEPAIEKGIQAARTGAVCVVDVRVAPGYDTNISGSGASQKR